MVRLARWSPRCGRSCSRLFLENFGISLGVGEYVGGACQHGFMITSVDERFWLCVCVRGLTPPGRLECYASVAFGVGGLVSAFDVEADATGVCCESTFIAGAGGRLGVVGEGDGRRVVRVRLCASIGGRVFGGRAAAGVGRVASSLAGRRGRRRLSARFRAWGEGRAAGGVAWEGWRWLAGSWPRGGGAQGVCGALGWDLVWGGCGQGAAGRGAGCWGGLGFGGLW